jgi:hypothetical protein
LLQPTSSFSKTKYKWTKIWAGKSYWLKYLMVSFLSGNWLSRRKTPGKTTGVPRIMGHMIWLVP